MDTAQWPQQGIVGVVKRSVESNQRVLRPHKDQALLNCPRCNSTNTKFCYYNNYSLSQPRYFCKTCRRYWTEGGSLRNVPVGGGSRKNKRSSSSSSSSSSSNPTLPNSSSSTNLQPCERMNVNHGGLGSSKLCQGGFMGPFGEAGQLFGAGFAGFQEMMRSGASIGGYGGRMEGEEGDGRLLFHFQDLKQGNVSNGGGHGGQGDPTTLFWNGVMGSGGGGGGGVNGGGGGGGAW